ncbi:hypothetical protein ACQ4PT_036675 [Festuca glaucescens]
MEKAYQHIAVCCMFIIASVTIGGCFPDITQFAIHSWNPSLDGKHYCGLEATVDVYGYNLEPQQQSLAAIWIYIIGERGKSSITGFSVGWHVYPELYNDSETHFVTTWAGNGSPPNGCYNMQCPGYIRTNSSIAPGDVIKPVSSFKGEKQYITIRALKDKTSGDWQVHYGFNGPAQLIGYFPSSLFRDMEKKQLIISFGGFASHTTKQASPVMGSGFFPVRNAASFNGLKFFDAEGYARGIDKDIPIYQSSARCYRVTNIVSDVFFYGGPGHCNI